MTKGGSHTALRDATARGYYIVNYRAERSCQLLCCSPRVLVTSRGISVQPSISWYY